eukprot:305456-Rhodomonas_salina.3
MTLTWTRSHASATTSARSAYPSRSEAPLCCADADADADICAVDLSQLLVLMLMMLCNDICARSASLALRCSLG